MADFRMLLPDGHGIMASVDKTGELTYVILGGSDSPIRGTEMFDLMMRAFGNQVGAIRGIWRRGHQGMPSVNLDKVNELTASGRPLEEAIGQAWTAMQARRWGFTKCTVVLGPIGTPGNYSKMDVLIKKSEGSS